jgi:hypothetical protein
MIAKSFALQVERPDGPKFAASSCSARIQLVETKLDMVRAAWLPQHAGPVCRFCLLDRVDRIQRDEVQ